MGYCFMTLEKIKNYNQLVGKYRHNYRKIDVLNADPEKADLNEELVKLNDKTYKEAFDEKLKSLGYGDTKKVRSNAVYAFEVVTTFSREDREHVDLEQWKKDNVEWLRKEFNADPEKYGDNVISVIYHADEPGNVHCHAIVVPIDDKGNLNARYYVRSRQKMIELQDSYGALMKKNHDLDRGIKNSTAKHQDIKRYYASLNAQLANSLPEAKDKESAHEYRARVNELYRESCLKTMALENKVNRLELEKEQLTKNAKSEGKKESIKQYKDNSDKYMELERQFGPYPEIEEKCMNYDGLLKGITLQEENRDDIIQLLIWLSDMGKEYNCKEKTKKEQENII